MACSASAASSTAASSSGDPTTIPSSSPTSTSPGATSTPPQRTVSGLARHGLGAVRARAEAAGVERQRELAQLVGVAARAVDHDPREAAAHRLDAEQLAGQRPVGAATVDHQHVARPGARQPVEHRHQVVAGRHRHRAPDQLEAEPQRPQARVHHAQLLADVGQGGGVERLQAFKEGVHESVACTSGPMSVQTAPRPRPSHAAPAPRRVVEAAAKGGLIGTVAALAAWVLAGALAATAWVVLIVATIAAVAVLLWRGSMATWVWLALAVGWAVVLIEREVVQDNGGLWVAAAGWLGVIIGARRAGINRWALPLLAYPLAEAAIVVLAGEDLAEPWGSSWLWVLAVLGPVIGAQDAGEATRRFSLTKHNDSGKSWRERERPVRGDFCPHSGHFSPRALAAP